MTALNTPIPIPARSQPRGTPVDDFVDRLSHPAPVQSANAVVAAFQCAISFGLLPLVLWPMRWAEFLESERQDLLDLTAWWRRRVAPADAARLDKISSRFKPRPILMVIPWLLAGFNAVLMTTLFSQGDPLDRLWDLTFKHARPNWLERYWEPALPLEGRLYTVWLVTLCAGYFLQWRAVRSHASAVRSLVQWTNRIGRENRFVRVKNQAMKIGLDPLWIVLAIWLCTHNAWWAIPMALAGAMQRQYLSKTSPVIRQALAEQARDAFPVVQSKNDRFCAAGHCGARLPAPAKFCPRCGTAV